MGRLSTPLKAITSHGPTCDQPFGTQDEFDTGTQTGGFPFKASCSSDGNSGGKKPNEHGWCMTLFEVIKVALGVG